MGGGLPAKYGLFIRVLDVVPAASSLTRVSEVAVITNGATHTDAWVIHPVATDIRNQGLKIGMRFRPKEYAASQVEFTAGQTVSPGQPLPSNFVRLAEDPTVTAALATVFGPGGGWVGFLIQGAQIPALTCTPQNDRLFFRVTTPFNPHHRLDFEVFPVVAVTANFAGFDTHYALGVGVFTVGRRRQSLEFDTKTLGGF